VNAAYLLQHADSGSTQSKPALVAPRNSQATAPVLTQRTLAALQLFAGETMFGTEERKQAVRELLSSHEAKSAAWELVRVWGRGNHFFRSDLELICGDL